MVATCVTGSILGITTVSSHVDSELALNPVVVEWSTHDEPIWDHMNFSLHGVNIYHLTHLDLVGTSSIWDLFGFIWYLTYLWK